MGNGASLQVLGIGTYKLELHGGCTLLRHDVLYVQKFGKTCYQLLKLGFHFNFYSTGCDFYLGTKFYDIGILNDFVILDITYLYNNNNVVSYMTIVNDIVFVVKHARLGHIRQDRMNKLVRDGLLKSLKLPFPLENIVWQESLLGNLLQKPHGHQFLYNQYTLTSVA